MKNVQISEKLFFMLLRFHLLEDNLWQEEIEAELQRKLDAMTNRNLYTKYKTAPTHEEQKRHSRHIWIGKDTFLISDGDASLIANNRSVARPCVCRQKNERSLLHGEQT